MTTLDILPEVTCPPTDLWSDEPPLESDLHLQQIIILLSCLELLWQEKNDYYASGNLTIYYNEEQLKKRDFCGPDFFVVLDTEKHPRKSWVVWGEGGKYPNVIVEILSPSTANIDRNKHLFNSLRIVVNAAFLCFETSKLWVLICIFVDRWKAEGLR